VQARKLSFWQTFAPLMVIRRFWDAIRLRKYNREWLKNNPQMTIAEAISLAEAISQANKKRK